MNREILYLVLWGVFFSMAWTEGTAYGEWITICKMLPCEASFHRFVGLIFFTMIWGVFAILFLKSQLQNQKRRKK